MVLERNLYPSLSLPNSRPEGMLSLSAGMLPVTHHYDTNGTAFGRVCVCVCVCVVCVDTPLGAEAETIRTVRRRDKTLPDLPTSDE